MFRKPSWRIMWKSRRCRINHRINRETVSLQCLTVLTAIRRRFCVASWPLTKLGSTGIHQKPRNNWNIGFHPENPLRRRLRFASTTWRRAEGLQGSVPITQFALSPWQPTSLHLRRHHHSQIGRIKLRTSAYFTYSPDLTLCDFFLFQQRRLCKRRNS